MASLLSIESLKHNCAGQAGEDNLPAADGAPHPGWLGPAPQVFAFGRSEAGSDMPRLDSTPHAEPVASGYRFYAPQSLRSLTPVWTRRGLYGQANTAPARPQVGAPGRGRRQPSGGLPAAASAGQWGADGRARVKRGFVFLILSQGHLPLSGIPMLCWHARLCLQTSIAQGEGHHGTAAGSDCAGSRAAGIGT